MHPRPGGSPLRGPKQPSKVAVAAGAGGEGNLYRTTAGSGRGEGEDASPTRRIPTPRPKATFEGCFRSARRGGICTEWPGPSVTAGSGRDAPPDVALLPPPTPGRAPASGTPYMKLSRGCRRLTGNDRVWERGGGECIPDREDPHTEAESNLRSLLSQWTQGGMCTAWPGPSVHNI